MLYMHVDFSHSLFLFTWESFHFIIHEIRATVDPFIQVRRGDSGQDFNCSFVACSCDAIVASLITAGDCVDPLGLSSLCPCSKTSRIDDSIAAKKSPSWNEGTSAMARSTSGYLESYVLLALLYQPRMNGEPVNFLHEFRV